jgi:hypothetical protein
VALGSAVTGRPAPVQGLVVAPTSARELVALDAVTGTPRWRAKDSGGAPGASPATDGETVYGATPGGTLAAVAARDGRTRWRAGVGAGPVTSPALWKGSVYAVSEEGGRGQVSAVRASDGRVRWRTPLPSRSRSAPALVDGVVYVGADDGNLHALDATSGRPLWAFRVGGAVSSSAVVSGGRAYFGSEDGQFHAVGAPTLGPFPVPLVRPQALRPDRPADSRSRRVPFMELLGAGAEYRRVGDVLGFSLEMRLTAPPPPTTRDQIAYVWSLDYTRDWQPDEYVYLDLTPGATRYRATLERVAPGGLVTVNDRLPFAVQGTSVRVFLPLFSTLAAGGAPPRVAWKAYGYARSLPALDGVARIGNRPFLLGPPR